MNSAQLPGRIGFWAGVVTVICGLLSTSYFLANRRTLASARRSISEITENTSRMTLTVKSSKVPQLAPPDSKSYQRAVYFGGKPSDDGPSGKQAVNDSADVAAARLSPAGAAAALRDLRLRSLWEASQSPK